MISTRSVVLVIDTIVCLTLHKWETVSGPFGGYLIYCFAELADAEKFIAKFGGEKFDPQQRGKADQALPRLANRCLREAMLLRGRL